MKKTMKTFTIILHYPDYYTNNWPVDIYVDPVKAASWEEAVIKLQKRLYRRINRGGLGRIIEHYTDLTLVIAIEGKPKLYLP